MQAFAKPRCIRKTPHGLVELLAALPLLATACASNPGGGHFVTADYKPRILQTYSAEGDVSPEVSHALVSTEKKGLAFLERNPDGTGILLETHWSEAQGDHFAIWLPEGRAIEVFAPTNRTQPAFRFDYAPGYYKVIARAGIERPVPTVFVAASAKLTPSGETSAAVGSATAPSPAAGH